MLAPMLRQVALVAIVATFVMFTNLGGPRLWDRDEPRNARCAWEMLSRNDWVVPTFNGELRPHKPVLLYWGMMASYAFFGVSEFSARLPSALCGVASCICVYFIGRRLFGPRAGLWAGIALATSLMFVVAGRAATPDSVLILCTTLALAIYVKGTFQPRFETTPADAPPQLITPGHYFPQHWPTVLAMYAVMGLAVLAKGPIMLLLPTAVIGMFLLIARLPPQHQEGPRTFIDVGRRMLAPFEPLHFLATCWYMRLFTAVFAATAVALPWYWSVGMATDGEFLNRFFLEHHFGRAITPMEGHRGNILFYPAAVLLGCFPWSVFAVPLAIDAALQIRRRDRFHAGYVFAACWIGVYVGLFSLASTKLPSYVTPCYPAIALLIGDYFDRWSRQSAAVAGNWLIASFSFLALGGIAIATLIPVVVVKYLPHEEWLGLIGLLPIVGAAVCIGLVLVRNYQTAAGAFGLTAVLFAPLLFGFGADRVDLHQQSHRLLDAIRAHSSNPQVATFSVFEPSWVFYNGSPIREFSFRRNADPTASIAAAAEFLSTAPESFVITTQKGFRTLAPSLPPDIVAIETIPYFLKDETLLVLTRRPPDLQEVTTALPATASAPWTKRQ